MNQNHPRILLIQLRQLGDILLTTPCAQALKRRNPGVKIDVLTHKMGLKVLERNPFIDNIITYTDSDSIWSFLKLIQNIRKRNYLRAYDFMGNPRSTIFTTLSGAKQKIGFKNSRSFFLNTPYTHTVKNDYIVREKLSLLQSGELFSDEALRQIKEDMLPRMFWPIEADYWAHDWVLTTFGKSRQVRVVLSPTHRRPARQWPAERYAELSSWLHETFNAHITWLWGPGEFDFVKNIVEHPSAKGVMASETSFPTMAALISAHDLFIGNSNGPSHVAIAASTPSIQLHGHTNGASWCPNIPGLHTFVQAADYFEGVEAKNIMGSLSVDSVKNAASKLCKNIKLKA